MRLAIPFLLLVACATPQTSERTEPFDASLVSRVDVQVDAGEILVVPGDAGTIEASLSWRGDVPPTLATRIAGGTLLVGGACPETSLGCAIDLVVTVPAATDVDVLLGSGTVAVERIDGIVDLVTLDADAILSDLTNFTRADIGGDVNLERVAGRVDVVATGVVTGKSLAPPTFQLLAGRQPIDLVFDDAPDLTQVITSAGDVALDLPSGEYDLTVTSRRGEVSVEGLTNTSNADAVVVVTSQSGDVTVRGR